MIRPAQAPDLGVGAMYDRIPTYLGEARRYINQGYWKDDPPTHDAASEALAALLGRVAGLGPGQQVLDAGFGYGEQDFDWLRDFGPDRIVGVNLSAAQVAEAVRRARGEGVADRLEFHQASATDLPFFTDAFDRVVALESAHHFDTRADFFAEAFRVLRPGGRLATTDIIPMPGRPGQVARALGDAVSSLIPAANLHDRDEYARQMRGAGFTGVRVVSIREHVWGPQARFLARRLKRDPGLLWKAAPTGLLAGSKRPSLGEVFFHLQLWGSLAVLANPLLAPAWIRAAEDGPLDYVVAVGDRPAEGAA